MSLLRPGEKKILSVLQNGPKLFKELKNETGLSPNALSPYLKNLQKNGLVERDIQNYNRPKYALKEISVVSLLFNDIITFIKEHLKKTIHKDLMKGVNLSELPEGIGLGWIVLTDNSDLRRIISEDLRKDIEVLKRLGEISSKIESFWESYLLDTYEPTQRKIIEIYKQYLLELVKIYLPKKSHYSKESQFEELKEDTRKKLEQSYPDVDIPEKMVEIETERRFNRNKSLFNEIMQPENLRKLVHQIEFFQKMKFIREESDFTSEEEKKLDKMIEYLKKHHKLYEDFISRMEENRPKTLLMYPSYGFRDYGKKFVKLAKQFNDVTVTKL